MFYINKVVGVMMSPSVLLMLICIVCAWRLSKRNSQTSQTYQTHQTYQTFLWLALALLWFWMSEIPARILGLPLEREWLVNGEIPTAESFPKADAIVCLGGSMNIATNLGDHAEMYTSADRVRQAARLYKAGKAPKVFVTGRGTARATRALLMDFGVPESAITLLENARNTEEESKSTAALLQTTSRKERASTERKSGIPRATASCEAGASGVRRDTAYSRWDPEEELPSVRALLVTSAWHMRRAKLMFEKYAKGVEIIPAPADFEATVHASEGFDPRDLLPGNSYMNEVYLREWIGYFGYKWLR